MSGSRPGTRLPQLSITLSLVSSGDHPDTMSGRRGEGHERRLSQGHVSRTYRLHRRSCRAGTIRTRCPNAEGGGRARAEAVPGTRQSNLSITSPFVSSGDYPDVMSEQPGRRLRPCSRSCGGERRPVSPDPGRSDRLGPRGMSDATIRGRRVEGCLVGDAGAGGVGPVVFAVPCLGALPHRSRSRRPSSGRNGGPSRIRLFGWMDRS
jgi:hypothetical protein